MDGVQAVPPTVAPDTVMILDLAASPPKVLGRAERAEQRRRRAAERRRLEGRVLRAGDGRDEDRSGRRQEVGAGQQAAR